MSDPTHDRPTHDKAARDKPARDKRRRDARQILSAAVAAADPRVCVERNLRLDGDDLVVADRRLRLYPDTRIRVVGAGKATPAMAQAAQTILGPRLDTGAISTKYGHTLPLDRIRTTECGHPIPDEAGVRGADAVVSCLQDLTEQDVVLCLLSGGGSALLPAPAPGLSLADKQAVTARLLECGAVIDEINTVRKHLSRLKGGQLARHAAPARLVTLAISDVIGDPPETIASGPTVADPTCFDDCLRILDRFELRADVPAAVRTHLERGAAGEIPDTPGPDAPEFSGSLYEVIGNNTLAVDAARAEAEALGYHTLILSTRIAGETADIAGMHVAIGREILDAARPTTAPACVISGGETTVTLPADAGKGGRNQHFALVAAAELDGVEGITALCAGTDGTDGPTDAAGAIADSSTVTRAAALGLSTAEHIARCDAYRLFAALNDLVITGPTGTNVMDLRLILVG